jgi:tetratricopeptide (TPR) repeat protein
VRFVGVCVLLAGTAGLLSVALAERSAAQRASSSGSSSEPGPTAPITIDYPPQAAILPPELPPIAFRWRDSSHDAALWRIVIAFADGSPGVDVKTPGARMHVAELDPRCVAPLNRPPVLTPEETAGRIWTPDRQTWAAIRAHSGKPGATIAITGFASQGSGRPVSFGQSAFETSKDPVGAPIFYRDVPLIPAQTKGELGILPKDAIILIKWRLRNVAETQSRVLMEGIPTCANCHSFSSDGKTIGLDVDGPMNDKSLYAVVPLRKETAIRTRDVFKWNTRGETGRRKLRAGFMSQVSPDGKYVVTTMDERDPLALTRAYGLEEKFYFTVYKDYRFGQVFYPTRGVLLWREVATGRTEPLPGADDPAFVQTDGVWSPDGKWIVFARAKATTAFPPGAPPATFANDPNETQLQYGLYRIPFNEGRGGKPEVIEGAAHNGFSNNFPKVTPDGRWIVYVRCQNGQLMRPDSRLFVVPFEGGPSRPMKCNTPLMNSWHSFSPNGRWMVFASKARSPYTQLYLTHLDPDGNDSPPILIENTTASNRAANIPEFLNIPQDGFQKLEIPASEFYRVFDAAVDLMQKGHISESIPEWRKAIELDPEDERARVNLGAALDHDGQAQEAIEQYRKATEIAPEHAPAYDSLAYDLVRLGRLDQAIEAYSTSLGIDPANPRSQTNLGTALYQKGSLEKAIQHCQKALDLDSTSLDAQNTLGLALAKQGRLDEAITHLRTAASADPESLQYQNNLARFLAQAGRFQEAIPHMERAVKLSHAREPVILSLLAAMYAEVGRMPEAIDSARQALALANRNGDRELAANLNARIARYQAKVSGK